LILFLFGTKIIDFFVPIMQKGSKKLYKEVENSDEAGSLSGETHP